MGVAASESGFLPVIEEDTNSLGEWVGRLGDPTRLALEVKTGDEVNVELDLSDSALSDDVVDALAERTPARRAESMTKIDLSYNCELRRPAIRREFRNLEFVALARCVNLTDDAIAAVARSCPSLASLDLSACEAVGDCGVVAVAEARRAGLTQLNLQRCARLTDRAVRAIAHSCHALRLLCLAHCASISDHAVQYLAKRCVRLEWLDVCECRRVADHAGTALASHCVALDTLVLAGSAVTDCTVFALANSLRDLVSLNLSFCSRVSGSALVQVTRKCSHLRELMLAGCTAVSHVDVLAIVTAGDAGDSRLQNLVLSGCKGLDDDDLKRIITACPWLLTISVIGCDNISLTTVDQIKKANPELQIYV